jgi:hypothetical protein
VVLILVVAAVISLIAYVIADRLLPKHKATLAVAAFVLLGIAPLAYIVYIGDRTPEDAVPVTQEDLRQAAGSAP